AGREDAGGDAGDLDGRRSGAGTPAAIRPREALRADGEHGRDKKPGGLHPRDARRSGPDARPRHARDDHARTQHGRHAAAGPAPGGAAPAPTPGRAGASAPSAPGPARRGRVQAGRGGQPGGGAVMGLGLGDDPERLFSDAAALERLAETPEWMVMDRLLGEHADRILLALRQRGLDHTTTEALRAE